MIRGRVLMTVVGCLVMSPLDAVILGRLVVAVNYLGSLCRFGTVSISLMCGVLFLLRKVVVFL